jgi:hypothetical protein
MTTSVDRLAVVHKVIDTLSQYYIARNGEIQDLDMPLRGAIDISLYGFTDLLVARDCPKRNVVPNGIGGEVADDLVDVETTPRVQFGADNLLRAHGPPKS